MGVIRVVGSDLRTVARDACRLAGIRPKAAGPCGCDQAVLLKDQLADDGRQLWQDAKVAAKVSVLRAAQGGMAAASAAAWCGVAAVMFDGMPLVDALGTLALPVGLFSPLAAAVLTAGAGKAVGRLNRTIQKIKASASR